MTKFIEPRNVGQSKLHLVCVNLNCFCYPKHDMYQPNSLHGYVEKSLDREINHCDLHLLGGQFSVTLIIYHTDVGRRTGNLKLHRTKNRWITSRSKTKLLKHGIYQLNVFGVLIQRLSYVKYLSLEQSAGNQASSVICGLYIKLNTFINFP